MKKLDGWRKALLIICTLAVIFRIGYIVFRDEVDKAYRTSTRYDLTEAIPVSCLGASQTFIANEDRLNSIELMFSDIVDDKAGSITVKILSKGELIYQTNISLKNVNNLEWKKVYVNAELSRGDLYEIVFSASEDCAHIPNLLLIDNGSHASEIRESQSRNYSLEGQLAINYGYLVPPHIIDKLAVVSIWILFLLMIALILFNFDKIQDTTVGFISYLKSQIKPQILLTVSEIILCFIVINSSGIAFQAPTQIVLYLVSLIAIVNYSEKYRLIRTITDERWQRVLVVLLYIYAAFAMVGQRIFIYPLTLKLTTAGLFVFVCTVFWFIPIINSVIYYIDKAKEKAFCESKKMTDWQFVLLSICLLLIPAFYNLIAYNPGISTPDTVSCMIRQAQHLHGSANWHPAFYCMVLHAIQKIWDSTYAVIFVQYFFWAYVCLELTLYLRKKGFKESVLTVITLFLGINAGNYIHLNTIWKDIPYALSVFWSVVIMSKLLISYDEYKAKWYIYLELIISLVGMSLYRHNGVVPFIIIMTLLVIVLRKNRKVWGAVFISIALFAFIKGPVYNHFDIQPITSGMYIGLGQDILGVYYAGGEISEDTLKMINIMTGYNNAEFSYNPTWAPYCTGAFAGPAKDFIIGYIDTFLKNPVIMTRAIIDREDAVWDIYAGRDSVLGCVNCTMTMDYDETWHSCYRGRKFVSLYNVAIAASNYTASSQWIAAIEWRCGLFTLLGILSALVMFFKKRKWKYTLLLSPIFGHIAGLVLSTGWSDFRYFWPLNLMNLALILIVIVVIRGKDDTSDV